MNDLNNSIYPLFVSGSNVMAEELFTNCTRTVGIQFLAGLVSELKHIQLPRITWDRNSCYSRVFIQNL